MGFRDLLLDRDHGEIPRERERERERERSIELHREEDNLKKKKKTFFSDIRSLIGRLRFCLAAA